MRNMDGNESRRLVQQGILSPLLAQTHQGNLWSLLPVSNQGAPAGPHSPCNSERASSGKLPGVEALLCSTSLGCDQPHVSRCLAMVPGSSTTFVHACVLSAGYNFIWLPTCWPFASPRPLPSSSAGG